MRGVFSADDDDRTENYFFCGGTSDRCYGIKILVDCFVECGVEKFDIADMR